MTGKVVRLGRAGECGSVCPEGCGHVCQLEEGHPGAHAVVFYRHERPGFKAQMNHSWVVQEATPPPVRIWNGDE